MGIKVKRRTRNYLGRDFSRERMSDKQSLASRSSQMSKIRSKNTKFEENFITLLKSRIGHAFDTHDRSIKGTPDIVFRNKKLCIFLDSDFWHGWQYPRWKHLMKNEFWKNKIDNNRRRDLKTTRFLRKAGWSVIRIWEHQIKENPRRAVERVTKSVREQPIKM